VSRYGNRADVAAKIDWEGGMDEVLYYGLTSKDMPEGDDELIDAWDEMVLYWDEFRKKANRVEVLLQEPPVSLLESHPSHCNDGHELTRGGQSEDPCSGRTRACIL
jgi:hypothetical protein